MDFLEEGGTYHIISDITRLTRGALRAHEKFDPDAFITAMQKKVGPEGTLLFPTFCYGFCSGETFDIKNTPGTVGVLGNAARVRNDFIRTSSPTHSFAVWGKYQQFFASKDYKNAFGEGSIFEDFLKMNVKVLVIDIEDTMLRMTIMHHAEQVLGVPYRLDKAFTGQYIDEQGNESTRTYSLYVRDYEADPKDKSGLLNPLLRELGVAKDYFINNIRFTVVDTKQVYEIVCMDIINNDSAHLYDFNHIEK